MPNQSEIDFPLEEINFNNLRRKRAFLSEVSIELPPEFVDAKKKKLLNFKGLPDILPIRPKENFGEVNYKKLVSKNHQVMEDENELLVQPEIEESKEH